MSVRGFLLLAATGAALVLAVGCGSSSGGSEVTVQTGALSKAEFIAKADAICKAARTEFIAKYTRFVTAHKSELGDEQKEKELLGEVLESLLAPNVEGQIKQIGKLGAPSDYAPEATSFLEALQTRLDEAKEDPTKLTATPFPFKQAETIAGKIGMNGCAESFS